MGSVREKKRKGKGEKEEGRILPVIDQSNSISSLNRATEISFEVWSLKKKNNPPGVHCNLDQ